MRFEKVMKEKDCYDCKFLEEVSSDEFPCNECVNNPNLPDKLVDHFKPKEG